MFSDLYAGRYENYFKSQSEADLSLCNMLSFWLGADPDKIDEAFRSSGLYRDKWDRRQSGSTYGKLTRQEREELLQDQEAYRSQHKAVNPEDNESLY